MFRARYAHVHTIDLDAHKDHLKKKHIDSELKHHLAGCAFSFFSGWV